MKNLSLSERLNSNVAQSKVVSVTLFGHKRKYIKGAEKLAKSVRRNLPDWQLIIFVGNSISSRLREGLKAQGVKIISVGEAENLTASAWRFRVNQLGNPDWVIFRDSDSIISKREANAINQWILSDLSAHIIRDHPFHSAKILAGLWGIRPARFRWFSESVQAYDFKDEYGSDQKFLSDNVYSRIISSTLVHASFHKHEPDQTIVGFESGSDRFGSFCGESVTSAIHERIYAKFRRLIDPKECNCVQLDSGF